MKKWIQQKRLELLEKLKTCQEYGISSAVIAVVRMSVTSKLSSVFEVDFTFFDAYSIEFYDKLQKINQ